MYQETTEEVTVTKTQVVSQKVWCDMCGAASKNSDPHEYRGEMNWIDQWEHDKTCVTRTQGWSHSGEGSDTIEAYHICPACWEKLAAWIESHRGAKPTITENWW